MGAIRDIGICCAAALLALAVPAHADSTDFSQLSIEQLANVPITSVSRRVQPLSTAAAAIFVITADDIRRSGFNTLPEVLRLAPNLEVARMNAFSYAITARGFNSPESGNKLLVLIDGRSVYSPLASTVFWENIDVPLVNIERIEVVSGPGGTLYGANAVNGVINIVTKNSADTLGFAIRAGAGPEDESIAARYGFKIGDNATLRLHVRAFDRGNTEPATAGDLTQDAWAGSEGGFRFDANDDRNTYFLEGNAYGHYNTGTFYENGWGQNITGSWSHMFDGGSTLLVSGYVDNARRTQFVSNETTTTYDLLSQYTTSLGWNDVFTLGGEYRVWKEKFDSFVIFAFADPNTTISLGDVYAQDEFSLNDQTKLTLGLRVEENSYSGLDVLPNARLAWQADKNTLLWASVSRAVRTPSKIDRELEAPTILVPAPDFQSETLWAYEAGYRGTLTDKLSLSVSLFFNHYDDLRSDGFVSGAVLPIILQNGIAGNTFGLEAWATYTATDWWRLSAGFNYLHKDLHLKPGFTDISFGQSEGQDPAYQAQLRSQMNFDGGWEADLMLRGVGTVTRPFVAGPVNLVPAYVEADARVGWQITDTIEVSVAGYNLLHARHLEAFDPSTYVPRYIERTYFVNLSKSF